MKIERDIKELEWVTLGNRYGPACFASQNAFCFFAVTETNKVAYEWSLTISGGAKIKVGVSKTLDEAKSDAFEAYLNLIFH